MASDTPILPAHIEETVQSIARLHAEHYPHASPHFASMTETVGGLATVRAGLSDGRVVTSG